MSYKLWDTLDELRSDAYEWVDLTHLMDNESPYWSGIPDGSVELCKTCFDWGNDMLDCLIQTFKFPGQFGTHIDFPGHFIKNAPLSEKYGVRDMIFPLCVIDITGKVKKDVHYAARLKTSRTMRRSTARFPTALSSHSAPTGAKTGRTWPSSPASPRMVARTSPAGPSTR